MLKRFWVLMASLALASCSLAGDPKPPAAQTTRCEYAPAGSPARPVEPPAKTDVPTKGIVTATLQLTEGDVTITMDRANAPCAVHSFQSLAMQGFYNDMRCHRLTEQGIFVLQCGDPTGTSTGGPGYVFADELSGKESYTTGVVAMANAGPNTNGSQFFIVWADSSTLAANYTVLGKVDDAGLKVIQGIAAMGIDRDQAPKPISPAQIKQVVMG